MIGGDNARQACGGEVISDVGVEAGSFGFSGKQLVPDAFRDWGIAVDLAAVELDIEGLGRRGIPGRQENRGLHRDALHVSIVPGAVAISDVLIKVC